MLDLLDLAPGLRIPQSSSCVGLPGKPFAFELHRADISQRSMQPGFVVPEQPGNGFILGVAPGHEALPVQALDLQRAEQCLAAGIDAPMSSGRCQQLPRRLIELVIPYSWSTPLKAPLAYWLPRSLWKTAPQRACPGGA